MVSEGSYCLVYSEKIIETIEDPNEEPVTCVKYFPVYSDGDQQSTQKHEF